MAQLKNGRAPFVLRQRKRLERGDPIKLEGMTPDGARVIYSGVVVDVSPDGKTVQAKVRTETELLDVTLEIPELPGIAGRR